MQHLEENFSDPLNMSGRTKSLSNPVDDAFDQDFSNKVLFCFDFPDSGDSQ